MEKLDEVTESILKELNRILRIRRSLEQTKVKLEKIAHWRNFTKREMPHQPIQPWIMRKRAKHGL